MTTNIIEGMPSEDYFANPAFGSTSIRYLSDPEISLQEVKHLLSADDEHKKAHPCPTVTEIEHHQTKEALHDARNR